MKILFCNAYYIITENECASCTTPSLSHISMLLQNSEQTHTHTRTHRADLALAGIVLHGSTSMEANHAQTYPHPPILCFPPLQ